MPGSAVTFTTALTGGQRQRHLVRDRERRADVHGRQVAVEARLRDLDTIDAERKVHRHVDAGRVDDEGATDLRRIALQRACGLARRAGRIADLDAHLSHGALCDRDGRRQYRAQQCQDSEADHSSDSGTDSAAAPGEVIIRQFGVLELIDPRPRTTTRQFAPPPVALSCVAGSGPRPSANAFSAARVLISIPSRP